MNDVKKFGTFKVASNLYVANTYCCENDKGEALISFLLKKIPEKFQTDEKAKTNEEVKSLPLFGKKEGEPVKQKFKRKKNGFDISNAKEGYFRSEALPVTKKLVEQFDKNTEYSTSFKDRIENIKSCFWNQNFAGYILTWNGRPLSIRRLREGKIQPTINVYEKVQTLDTIFNLLKKAQVKNYYGFSIGCIFYDKK